MATVMGMNLSNKFMSSPISLLTAAKQIQALGIGFVKLFDWDKVDRNFSQYVVGSTSPIHVALGIPNHRLAELSNSNGAQKLVREMIGACSYGVGAVNNMFRVVKWICVGNEPLGSWHNDKYLAGLSAAVTNVYDALKAAGYPNIGVTVPQNFEFMDKSWPPSHGKIKDKFKGVIKSTCGVIKDSKAPFMVNIYPFLTRKDNPNDVPLNYAIFQNKSPQFMDSGKPYFNLFDAMLDALHFALKDIGYQDLEIVVGECGWPTSGYIETSEFAEIFLKSLKDHCKSGKGTPMRPNKPIQCFVFEMYDEDKKSLAPGQFEAHWGICDGQGKPKFPNIQW
jgi:hypothetical protein